MSITPAPGLILDGLWSFWPRATRGERLAYSVGGLLLISGLVHLTILVVSGSSFAGPRSFRKPTVFGLSFGLTLITVVWVASFLRLSNYTRALLVGGFSVASIVVTALVSLQAWRGVPSHFNVATPLDALISRTLAAGGVTLVAIVVLLTVAAFRPNAGIPGSLLLAIRSGFLILCGSMAVGGLMIARGMSLVFAGNAEAAYAMGGALKPEHAVTMHGILLLPMLAWLLSLGSSSESQRLTIVKTAIAGYLLLIAAVTLLF